MKLKLRNPLDKIYLFRKETEPEWGVLKKLTYWLWRFVFLLAFGAGVGYIALQFAYAAYPAEVFAGYLASPELLLANILPAVWLIFALYALIGHVGIVSLLGGGAVLALSLGNYFKLLYRDDPLIFEDLMILREAGMMASGDYYDLVFDDRIKLAIGCVLLGALFLAIFARGFVKSWKLRVALVLVACISGAALFQLCCDETRYQSVKNYEHLNQWNQTQNYVAHGCLYPFVYSIGEAMDSRPDGYTKGKAEKVLAQYEDADIPEDKKINLITVMREAYVDFSKFDIEGLDVSGYESYHALQEESYTGTLMTNIFAGGTIDSERSFLTGLGEFHNFRTDTNSYLWYLRDQGYTVEGSHPYYSWFYQRDTINYSIGFEKYRFLEGDYELLDGSFYVHDEIFYSEIYNDFVKNKESGKPYFSFNLNIQSHGPYFTDIFIGFNEYLTGGDYTQECRNAMNNYMFWIMDSDVRLMEFVEKLRADPEPIVLVVYTDHLPWMGDGNSFYQEMGIDVNLYARESFHTRFETDYLIWANDAARELLGNDFKGTGPTISPFYLMNLVFEQCGWEGPAYMQAMDELREVFPVITSNDFLVVDGTFIERTRVPEERQELYEEFLYLQYYWRNEFLYREVKNQK